MRERIRQMDLISKILLILILFSLFLILMNVAKIYIRKVRESTYLIVLEGDNPMIVYQEDTYVEPGYRAYNYLNKDSKDLVKVINNIDTNIIGEYNVIYNISNFFRRNTVTRKVNVIENPLKYVDFTLKGEAKMELARDSKYTEQGFNVISDKGDFTNNVTINNEVNVYKVGMYDVKYTLKIGNKEKTIKRIVNVVGDKYTATIDNKEPTNQNVKIMVTNNLKDFDHFINPNNVEIYEEKFEFLVEKNGEYVFNIVDTNGIKDEFKVNITNIDKTGPTGTCNVLIKDKKTSYTIAATDPNGVSKYTINGVEYLENNIIVNEVIDTPTIDAYDKIGNKAAIACNIEYEYIGPNSNAQYKYESDTLKYWLEKPGHYVTTHIWVKDAYNQLGLAIPNKKGSVQTGKTIISNEINKLNYSNKGLVAINASGIVGGGFGTKFSGLNPAWEGTTAIPYVLNKGEVIRDSINSDYPDTYYITYGLKKDGYLGYYRLHYRKEVTQNTNLKNQMISDGVKNTFAFSPVLVYDGEIKNTQTEKNIRQAICQIDRNNFVFVTNTNSTDNRGVGFDFNSLAQYMMKLNCKIGFNLDGGGSVNHYYKDNTSKLHSVVNSSRGLVDMLYFVEK